MGQEGKVTSRDLMDFTQETFCRVLMSQKGARRVCGKVKGECNRTNHNSLCLDPTRRAPAAFYVAYRNRRGDIDGVADQTFTKEEVTMLRGRELDEQAAELAQLDHGQVERSHSGGGLKKPPPIEEEVVFATPPAAKKPPSKAHATPPRDNRTEDSGKPAARPLATPKYKPPPPSPSESEGEEESEEEEERVAPHVPHLRRRELYYGRSHLGKRDRKD